MVTAGKTGIDFNPLSVPFEGYILDTVNFSGGGTYLSGIDASSDIAFFRNCRNVTNTFSNGQLYMKENATATIVSAVNTFYKVAGVTLPSADNSKFDHSNNRLTCAAQIGRKYLIQATVDFISGSGNVCEFGFYDSQLLDIRIPSRTKGTANSGGRVENLSFMCVVNMKVGDFIEVHVANTSSTSNITVENLNFTITEI